jgi:hypothetical protein
MPAMMQYCAVLQRILVPETDSGLALDASPQDRGAQFLNLNLSKIRHIKGICFSKIVQLSLTIFMAC